MITEHATEPPTDTPPPARVPLMELAARQADETVVAPGAGPGELTVVAFNSAI
ncbi:hypothetical protein [Kitasatospora sp. NPDC002040]|uniref:hypothetical protein n=1 Tax=Kitasatospora sp. NPDC002040 TaxID=3154661 RepID=UPI0033299667